MSYSYSTRVPLGYIGRVPSSARREFLKFFGLSSERGATSRSSGDFGGFASLVSKAHFDLAKSGFGETVAEGGVDSQSRLGAARAA